MLDLVPLASLPRAAVLTSTGPVPLSGPRVLKFGGSSLATPARVRDVGRIVVASAAAGPAVVVVSAFQHVTDQLLECARQAERGDRAAVTSYEAIAARHRGAATALIEGADREPRARVDRLLRALRDILRGIRLLGCCPPAAVDEVASFGERLAACIVSGHLNEFLQARFVDARDFLATDDQFTRASVNLAATNHTCREYFAALWREAPSAVPVVTGFIGRSDGGRTTTLGRNGSDYSAAIVGAALAATAIEIWTDVDGVLSADPKTVPGTFVMPGITYDDALEMSHAGAKVLHPATIGPAIARSIPIVVKNTFNPDGRGTRISGTPEAGNRPAGSVVSMAGLTLLTLRSSGRPAGRSIAERLSHALAARGIEVVLGSHACSALSTSFAVRQHDAPAALDAVQKEFCFELERGFATLAETSGQAMVTVVGAAAGETPGIPAGVFGALARHAIPVNVFAQGTSARSVSCLIDAPHESRARRVIHAELFERSQSMAIAVLGAGKVGGALLRELGERQPAWRERGIDIKVIAVADSTRCLLDPCGIDLRTWRDALRRSNRPADSRGLAAALAGLDLPNAVLVDCTAGTAVVDAYEAFVDARCHIVTPNKQAGVLPWARYAAFRETLAARRRRLLDSTTVGAGLPLLASVRSLIDGGDEIRKIEGILSGTLSYLFNSFDGRVPFSALVREAHAGGLTEPDPREDLSGHDVARKLLILAREAGQRLELEDVEVDSLLPPGVCGSSCHVDLFAALEAGDADFQRRFERARARGAVLRYVATLERGRAHAGVREVPRDHPLAAGRGCENIVAFTSERYSSTPLVIQGPGAGATLTARGLVADICRLLPARSA
jgi:aspartokinase/homoserine dehydrogenase 1